MAKNVTIPLTIMEAIIELLEYWDVSKNDVVTQLEHHNVLEFLKLKKRRLELRDDYAKIISAKNEDVRHDARIQYLQEKSWLREDEVGYLF
jgi:hypothetical protein